MRRLADLKGSLEGEGFVVGLDAYAQDTMDFAFVKACHDAVAVGHASGFVVEKDGSLCDGFLVLIEELDGDAKVALLWFVVTGTEPK